MARCVDIKVRARHVTTCSPVHAHAQACTTATAVKDLRYDDRLFWPWMWQAGSVFYQSVFTPVSAVTSCQQTLESSQTQTSLYTRKQQVYEEKSRILSANTAQIPFRKCGRIDRVLRGLTRPGQCLRRSINRSHLGDVGADFKMRSVSVSHRLD